MSEHNVSKLELLTYVTGDINEMRRREIEHHVDTCNECSVSVESLAQKKELFLKKYPVPVHTLKKRVLFHRYTRLLAVAASLVLVATATIYIQTGDRLYERIKGAEKIEMYVLDVNSRVDKRTSSVYYPGERIQFSYSCAGKKYFMLMSMDQNGKSFVYFPSEDSVAMLLKKGAGIPLSSSIELDNYVGTEVYIAVFSDKRFIVNDVVSALKTAYNRSGNLEHMNRTLSGFHTESFLIEKRQRP